MHNRLKEFFGEPAPPERRNAWFEVYVQGVTYIVDHATAAELATRLEQDQLPRWLVFRDVYGSEHRVPAASVFRLSESTAEQRQSAREFARARREEEAANRSWDENG